MFQNTLHLTMKPQISRLLCEQFLAVWWSLCRKSQIKQIGSASRLLFDNKCAVYLTETLSVPLGNQMAVSILYICGEL
jgi:hypothetical protein